MTGVKMESSATSATNLS